MADILIRGISQKTLARLKRRASAHRRSLQAELKQILEQAAAQASPDEMRDLAAGLRARLAGRTHSDSASLVAEDRGRRV